MIKRLSAQTSIVLGAALSVLCGWDVGGSNAFAAQSPQTPIAGKIIPQFSQPMPTLAIAPQNGTIKTVLGNQPLTIRMCEFDAKVLPPGTFAPGIQPLTRVWGYITGDACPTTPQDTYIGPVIVNNRGSSTDIRWVNSLGDTSSTGVLAWKYSTDQTLHWADPLNVEANGCNMAGTVPAFGSPCAANYGQIPGTTMFAAAPIPATPHLHGGEVPPELDGGPSGWFTSDGVYQGHGYYSFPGAAGNEAIYRYPNTQEAAPIWFHDHTLGATRLNVYAGLAGAYFIADPALKLPAGLQPLTEVVPVVLQDRMFDTSGQLFFQTDSAGNILWATNPDHPYWSPEFVGDTIVVNGKAWPFFTVEPRRYRFLFLNGSNARTYEMFLTNQATGTMGPPMWIIGTDGGYLDSPVKIDPALGQKLVMMPGERYEVIIDFTGFAGTNLLVRNTGRTPFPKGPPPNGMTLGRIMQFRVGQGPVVDSSYNPASGTPLRTIVNPGPSQIDQRIVRLVNSATGTLTVTPQKTRQLTLNEVLAPPSTVINPVTGISTPYPGGPLEILVNNTKFSGASPRMYNDFTPITVNGITTSLSELPREGDTEVWEVVNLTADAHPIHLHLVQFQILNRQNFSTSKYGKAYAAAFPAVSGSPACTGGVFCPGFGPPLDYNTGNPRAVGGNPDITPHLQGPVLPPAPNEAGWKDTAVMYPGQVTRIAVRWAPTDKPTTAAAANLYYPFDPSGNLGYVWHCHIIDHEDNEMMRPDVVRLNPACDPALNPSSLCAPASRPLVKGANY